MKVDGTALPPCKVHPLARPFASQSGRFLEAVPVKRKKSRKTIVSDCFTAYLLSVIPGGVLYRYGAFLRMGRKTPALFLKPAEKAGWVNRKVTYPLSQITKRRTFPFEEKNPTLNLIPKSQRDNNSYLKSTTV